MGKLKHSFMIFLLATNFAWAQKGNTSGKVVDFKTNEPLVGATILLTDTPIGAVTDIKGNYTIEAITPGSYNLSVSYIGYKSQVKFNVVVRSEGNPDVNFQLEEDLSQLNEVVVVANPFRKLEETPLSIQRLSQEEISSYPGGNNDIAKVVQSLPGVSNSVGGFRNDVIIRGGAPNENVYYLDGIEIPNINHFATQGSAGGPVGLLNVSFFEGVVLTTSAFGSQYDNVLSGVLQFNQRNGNARNFQGNFRLGSSEAALTLEGPLFKKEKEESKTTFLISGRRSYLQFVSRLIGLPFLPSYWDYQYKINHVVDDYNEVMITGLGSIDDFAVNEIEEFDPVQQAIQDQVPVIRQRTNTAGISWKRRFKDNTGFMQTTLSNNLLLNQFFQYQDNINENGLIFKNDSREQETKLRFNLTQFIGDWTTTYGLSLQNVDYNNTTEDLINNAEFISFVNFFRYGIFAQASRQYFKERLGFSAGIRADGNNYMDSGNELYRTLSPRLSLSYQLTETGKWTASTSVGRYSKIPPYTLLGFQDNAGNHINQNSQYIRSDHAVAGIEYLLSPSSRLSMEGFLKLYDNYPISIRDSISLANKGSGFEVLGSEPVASIGKGRTYGVELLYQQQFTGDFYAIAALTLYRSEFTGFDQNQFLPSNWDNRVLVSLTGGYKFGNNWEISGRYRLGGPTPYAPVNQEATLVNYPAIILDYSQLGNVRLETFSQLDARIDKKFNFRSLSLDAFLDIQNVLAATLPSAPQFGLNRNEDGEVLMPEQLVEVTTGLEGVPLPSIGLVINF